jgi:hypothetical protein
MLESGRISVGVPDDILDAIKFFEEETRCSGLCTKANFFYFIDISVTEQPEDNCVTAFKEYFNSTLLYGGVAVLVMGLLVACAFCT